MIKSIGLLVAGAVLGAGTVLLAQLALDEPAPAPQPRVASPHAPVPARTVSPTPEAVSPAQILDIPEGFERDLAIYDLLRGTDANGIEALLEEAEALDPDFPRGIIYRRYVEIAPRAALNHILSNETNAKLLIEWGVVSWGRSDLDAAVAFADTLAEPLRTEAATSLLNSIQELSDARKDEIAKRFSLESQLSQARAIAEAATNPGAAWQRALSIEAEPSRNDALWRISQRWFSLDPAAALSALEAVSASQRRTWLSQLLARWAATDREAALEWAISQPPSAKRTSLIGQVAAAAAKDSPVEMLELADTLDPRAKREVAQQVLSVWGRSEPRAALAALREMNDQRLTQMTESSLVHQWAESDPMAAFDWARTQRASESRTQALSTALLRVARSDPVEALALAEDLDKSARSNAIDSVLRQWGRDNPRSAAAWLDASALESEGAVAAIVGGYARLDAEEAVDWLLTKSADAQRRAASTIMWPLAEESPEIALKLIERLEDSTATMIAGSQLMSRWAVDDPRAAVRAIARLDNDARPILYTSAFNTWSRYDPEAAHAFIGQVPATGRDAAIQGVMQQALSDGDVDSAERLFERIVDSESRQAAATMMYMHFSQSDPERAERYGEMSEMTIAEDGSITVTIPAQRF